jgi:hypothetical protein
MLSASLPEPPLIRESFTNGSRIFRAVAADTPEAVLWVWPERAEVVFSERVRAVLSLPVCVLERGVSGKAVPDCVVSLAVVSTRAFPVEPALLFAEDTVCRVLPQPEIKAAAISVSAARISQRPAPSILCRW